MTTDLCRYKYTCTTCEYSTNRISQYNKHNLTRKHLMTTQGLPTYNNDHNCLCGKEFSCRQNLYRHRKTCNYDTSPLDTPSTEPIVQTAPPFDMSLVIELLKQNNEFKELMIEQSKQLAEQQQQLIEQQQQNTQLLEAVKDGKLGNNTTNTNCHNKFNLNVFLNETCKDAISMDDFINSLEVTRDDFIRTGNVGFVQGMSSVLVKRIRNMELHTRPMHCTDLKRETVYIKNEDKWEKEDMDKTHLRKAVKNVARKNMNELKRWVQDSKPEVETHGTTEYEDYFKYYKSALGGYDREEDKEFEEKIIKNVLKEVQVDKTITAV